MANQLEAATALWRAAQAHRAAADNAFAELGLMLARRDVTAVELAATTGATVESFTSLTYRARKKHGALPATPGGPRKTP